MCLAWRLAGGFESKGDLTVGLCIRESGSPNGISALEMRDGQFAVTVAGTGTPLGIPVLRRGDLLVSLDSDISKTYFWTDEGMRLAAIRVRLLRNETTLTIVNNE
jgi:hypothetical protein